MSTKKWNEENTQALINEIGAVSGNVTADQVRSAAAAMEITERSASAKLRKLGYTVDSLAKDKESAFSEEDTNALIQFIEANPQAYTYAEISEKFNDGEFKPRQIQGKILALELTSLVKASEKVEVARKYSESEEVEFIEMANKGAYIEDIAAHFNREVNSIRGKALALLSKGLITQIPTQRDSKAKITVDALDALGEGITTMRVADIAAAIGKTERGVKTSLTRRGISVADYDGAKKQEKARGKAAEGTSSAD